MIGANVSHRDKDRVTPIYLAAQNNHFEVMKLLAQHEADIDVECKIYETPLFIASQMGHLGVVEWLLESGVYVNRWSLNKVTALCIAVRNKRVDVVKALLKRGADPTMADNKNQGPLDAAR